MTFTPRDVKDVSALVAKKLEFYMNQERREDRFDTQGRYRTHPKMRTLDLMYQMLDATEISGKSQRRKHRSSSSKRKESKKTEEEECVAYESSEHGDKQKKGKKERSREKKKKIAPVVVNNSLRVVPHNEAERLTEIANKVFEEQDLDKLHVIHRYRPNSRDIAPLTENGKVANYTLHVGSALNSTNYVNYYIKEGLHSSKKDCAKRLQRLQQEKKEDGSQSQQENDTSPDGRKGQSETNDETEQPLFNPLIDQSTESLLSTSLTSGNLMPIDKDKPAYSTVFTSTRPSSRGSSTKESKASSQLNKARMFANGYGYRIVADKDNGFSVCDTPNRNESRADIASSEEYCKFVAMKNNSIDSGRTGDGVDAVAMSNIPPLNECDLDYNKFQSTQSSMLLSGMEEDSRAKSYYNNSRPSSQRSVRSQRSQRSYQSGKSSSYFTEGSMSACTEESDIYDTEAGPDTARSMSYPISTPGRSKKVYRPIETLISNKEVPPLGLASDINDSNGSWNTWTAEEYVTAEEKAKLNTDTRAIEDKKNASQERADDGILGNSMDDRADRSLQKVWSGADGNEINKAHCVETVAGGNGEPVVNGIMDCDKVTALPLALEDEANKDAIDSCLPLNTQVDNEVELKETMSQNTGRSQTHADLKEGENEKELAQLSSRTSKTSIDFNTDAGRPSSRCTNSSKKRSKGKEISDGQRGEDKIESMELHRGQVPDAEKNKILKVKIERGDDTPRTMAAKGRLTKSAKKRGMSNYYTMGDEERGLEKEYFKPLEKDFHENYVKASVTDEEEDPETPASSRPTSATSCSSGSSRDSGANQRKPSIENVIDHGKKNSSRSQSQVEKSIDGRGDDSVSIKSGSIASVLSGGKAKDRRSGSDRDEGLRKGHDRSGEQRIPMEPKAIDLSGGSRGSRSMHVKHGIGEGYCIEGELLNRGYDETVPRQHGKTIETEKEDSFKDALPKNEDNKPLSSSQKSETNRTSSRASQGAENKEQSHNEISQPEELKEKEVLSDSPKHEQSVEKDTSIQAIERHDAVENIAPESEVISLSKSDTRIPGSDSQHSSRTEDCEDGVKKTTQSEKTSPCGQSENKKISQPFTEDNDEISKPSVEENEKFVSPDEVKHTMPVNVSQTSLDKTEKQGTDNETMQNIPEKPEEKVALTPPEVGTPSQEIPVEEKAFVECDLSDHDVVKEAVSGSASMFNEDSDTVIDFRPSSASTAISVGREQSADQKRRPIKKPAKIVEVTETESNFGSARESYRSSKHEGEVLHPATKKKRENKEPGAILNIADAKLEQVAEIGEIIHPAIKTKSQNGGVQQSSRSASLPYAKSTTIEDEHDMGAIYTNVRKSQSADQLPYSHDIISDDPDTSENNVIGCNNNISEQMPKEKGEEPKENIESEKERQITHEALDLPNEESSREKLPRKEILEMTKEISSKDNMDSRNVQNADKEMVYQDKSDVKVENKSPNGSVENISKNLTHDDNIEGKKGNQKLNEDSAKEKQEPRDEGNINVERKDDTTNQHTHTKPPHAIELMLNLNNDIAVENSSIQKNVVADNISNKLKLNNETPRSPRPNGNVAMDRKESEIDTKDNMAKKASQTNCEAGIQPDPHFVETELIRKDGDVTESRPETKTVVPEKLSILNEAASNADDVVRQSGDKAPSEVQRPFSEVTHSTSRTDGGNNHCAPKVETLSTEKSVSIPECEMKTEEKRVKTPEVELKPEEAIIKMSSAETKSEGLVPTTTGIAKTEVINSDKVERKMDEVQVPPAESEMKTKVVEKLTGAEIRTEEEISTPKTKTQTEQQGNATNDKTPEVEARNEQNMGKSSQSETNTGEAVMKTSELKTEREAAALQTLEIETKTEELVIKAPEVKTKMEEAVIKAPEVETKSEEIVAKATEVEMKTEEVVSKAHDGEQKTEEAVINAPKVETVTEEIVINAHEVKTEREEGLIKAPEVESKPEEAPIKLEKKMEEGVISVPEDETKREEMMMKAPQLETKTVNVTVKGSEIETKTDEVVIKALEGETKTKEVVVNAPEVETKTDEALIKVTEVESKTEEAVIKVPEVVTKTDEAVIKSPEVETKMEEAVIKSPEVETKTDEAVIKSLEVETKTEEAVIKSPEVVTKTDEAVIKSPEVETKMEEAVIKSPEVETKTEEAVIKSPEVETKTEEAVIKVSEVETKTEEAVIKSPEVETKPEEMIIKAPEVETETADASIKASEVETISEEVVINPSKVELKTEEVMMKAPELQTKTNEVVVKASEIETKSEENILKAPEPETKTEEVLVIASEVETKAEDVVATAPDVGIPIAETKTE